MGENSVVLEGIECNLWREACSFVFFILSFLLLLHIFSFEHVKQAKRKFVCLYDWEQHFNNADGAAVSALIIVNLFSYYK